MTNLAYRPRMQSKELAAHNKSLPERVEVLMRRKKSKLEKHHVDYL